MELNCILIDDEPHAVEELSEIIGLTSGIKVLEKFYDVKSALGFLKEYGRVDVIFSDINMPGINGIDAAMLLNSHCDFLIFITAHKEYALDAFAVHADGYLVKPVSYKIFAERINVLLEKKAHQEGVKQSDNEVLFLKGTQKNTFIKIKYSDIVYIEAMLNYVIVHTLKGKEITYIGLSGMEKLLSKKEVFFRVSKSAIISVNYLDRVEGNVVRLTDKSFFPIGEKYRDAFHKFLRKRILNSNI